jgi:hypothetical protein
MTEGDLHLREQDYWDLLSFLVSSAFLLCHGERDEELYPSLRLMDAASRLTKAIISNGGFEDREWPQRFAESCDSSLDLVMTDEEAFVEFISQSTQMLAQAMKERSEDWST